MDTMRRATTILLIGTTTLALSGCAGMTKEQKGAIIGAAGGAVAGGAIGKAAGSTAKGAIIGAVVGGAAGAYIASRMDDKADQLRERLPDAEVERVGEGILITFRGGLLFDFDSAELRSDARAKLTDLARSLHDMRSARILVAGHTDSRGSEDYNYDLSLRRARAAANHVVDEGHPEEHVLMTGQGETEPVATNETAAGRQRNRRVEVAIYASDEMRAEARRRTEE